MIRRDASPIEDRLGRGKADIDLEALGEKLAARKAELKEEFSQKGLPTLRRSMQGVELAHDRPIA